MSAIFLSSYNKFAILSVAVACFLNARKSTESNEESSAKTNVMHNRGETFISYEEYKKPENYIYIYTESHKVHAFDRNDKVIKLALWP